MTEWQDLLGKAQRLVALAQAEGATESEAYAYRSLHFGATFTGGYPATRRAEEVGIALRVAIGKRLGAAGATGFADATMRRLVAQASRLARSAPENARFPGFPSAEHVAGEPASSHARVTDDAAEGLAADAAIVSRAMRAERAVTYTLALVRARAFTYAIANSRGLAVWDADAREDLTLEARATGGSVDKTAMDFLTARRPLGEVADLGEMAASAARRARSALEPRAIETGKYDVILEAAPVGLVLAPLVASMRGGLVASGSSSLAKRMGERVASPALTMHDLPRGATSGRQRRVDDEGVPTRDVALLDRGVVRGFMHDSASATALAAQFTGNALRPMDLPSLHEVGIRSRSLDVAPGRGSLDDLIAGSSRAVLVRDHLMGGITADRITGGFSLVAPMAFLVEDGVVKHALPHMTVAGNVFKLIEDVDGVSAERKSLPDGTYPAMKLKGVTCAC
ncbi:MAG: TldD/PmbA family protein [Thermoplasmatota archaeon]